jgi:hypothetical protein
MSFDIVIPLGPNDVRNINRQIEYTKKNVIGHRNIYLISYDPTILIDGCITIDESIFPFSISILNNFFSKFSNNLTRTGWYLQQLLKLYAGIVIENILETYLVIDADVFFLKPTVFLENKKFIFTTGYQYHIPYFEHMKRMSNTFIKNEEKSGISHHMIFHTPIIKEIFNIVESTHSEPFWMVFIKMVDEANYQGSGASEYELYFNYIIKKYSEKVTLRELNWTHVSHNHTDFNMDFDYLSLCWYI